MRTLEVPAWKARRLAQATHHLSREAAAHVDRRLEGRLGTGGARMVDQAVAQAAAIDDPDAHAEAERRGRSAWDVTLTHPTDGSWAGTSQLQATGDTLDLIRFHDLVCDHAAQLAALGDTDDLGARKAKALGVIADAQTSLELGRATRSEHLRRPTLVKTRLYLHVGAADLSRDVAAAVGTTEQLGPATVSRIRDWVGHSRVTIVPVLDLRGGGAVDEHDPPPWMRETVILRDPHCVFPWCARQARACDLDHIEPYVPPDDGGPPGQTSPQNLAPLCRRHHRVKTAGRWRYRRERDGSYTWQGPHGLLLTVTRWSTQAR